jgi:PadR family transcriptional regulator PadR
MGNPGEFELLVLLAIMRLGDGAYGVTVREELETETSRTLTLGAIYKTLGRLEGKGYLETRVAPPTRERGGRRKKLYSLTPPGLETARRSLADLRRMTKGLEPELELL